MTIRRAEEKDIPKILDLLVQVDMIHHNARPDIFKGPATKYNDNELRAILKNEATPIFICTDEKDIPFGHAFCIHKQITGDSVLTDIRTLYIDDICIDSSARGKHIGKKLFDYVKGYAKSMGFYNITLNVWSCNKTAMKFYEAMGLQSQKTGMELIL